MRITFLRTCQTQKFYRVYNDIFIFFIFYYLPTIGNCICYLFSV